MTTARTRPATRSTGRASGSPARGACAALIRGYQHLFAWKPSPCRYTPTCSTYAIEAIEAHGALAGHAGSPFAASAAATPGVATAGTRFPPGPRTTHIGRQTS